jgi:DNA-binding MarR family transcriptional regulator
MSDAYYLRAANLLGALALAVSDVIREATEQQADGLTRSEPAALVTLAHYPGQPVGTLGRTLGLTHSGAVRLADRLEACGRVCRTSPGRGRTLALYLTEAGHQAAMRVLARRRVAVEQLVSRLTPDESAALERLMGRLLTAMTTDRASAHRLCRLCDEPMCAGGPGCPVDHAAGA